jgi:hypothetical protein
LHLANSLKDALTKDASVPASDIQRVTFAEVKWTRRGSISMKLASKPKSGFSWLLPGPRPTRCSWLLPGISSTPHTMASSLCNRDCALM